MSKLMSKSKLMPMLVERGFISDAKRVGYEAFGRKVFAFIPVKDMEKSLGVYVGTSYSPGRPVVEAQVSYFKAWHWDE